MKNSANNTMRVAMIGGVSTVAQARATLPAGCVLVGLCDIREELVEAWKSEAPGLFCTTDYREIAAMEGCDVICQFTPNACHVEISLACLAGGKHVWMEKPIGITLEEGATLLHAWRQSGRHIAVDLEFRYSYLTGQCIKKIIESGEIGEVISLEHEHWRGGWTWERESAVRRTKKETSGQMLMEGIHQIDYFRYLCGEIAAIQAFAAPSALPHYEFPDNINLVIWFESGAMGNYRANHTRSAFDMGAEQEEAIASGHTASYGITGTKGSLICDLWSGKVKVMHYVGAPEGTIARKVKLDRVIDFGVRKDWYQGFHDMVGYRRDFLTRLVEGRPPLQDFEDAFKSEIIAVLCDESLCGGNHKIEVQSHFAQWLAASPAVKEPEELALT